MASGPAADEPGAVLRANAAFYGALARGDAEAMDGLWARRHPVVCCHPGALPLVGRTAVMQSWRSVLRKPPAVECASPQALLLGEVAIVVCFETFPEGRLAATNAFAREDGAWRMVHHHAGPTPPPPATPPRAQLH
jgi:hypothetical protein